MNLYDFFDELDYMGVRSITMMRKTLCKSDSCKKCEKYPDKCTYKERQLRINCLFLELEKELEILINGDDNEIKTLEKK
jgi:hypothetical protein